MQLELCPTCFFVVCVELHSNASSYCHFSSANRNANVYQGTVALFAGDRDSSKHETIPTIHSELYYRPPQIRSLTCIVPGILPEKRLKEEMAACCFRLLRHRCLVYAGSYMGWKTCSQKVTRLKDRPKPQVQLAKHQQSKAV